MTIRTTLSIELIAASTIARLSHDTARAASPAPISPATTRAAAAAANPAAPDPDIRVIHFLEDRVRRDPDDVTALNRLSGEYLRRFRRSGDDRDLTRASDTAAQSLLAVPAEQNAAALAARACAVFALHGFAAVRDMALQLAQLEPAKRYPVEILGDALWNWAITTRPPPRINGVLRDDPDVNTQTRLCALDLIKGDTAAARTKLDSASEMARAMGPEAADILAWCLVQAGQLAFGTGDWDAAEKNYQAALTARPNDWPPSITSPNSAPPKNATTTPSPSTPRRSCASRDPNSSRPWATSTPS